MITDKNGNTYYKVGLHIHTNMSDGKNTLEEVITEYKANGYDAVAITDHWKVGKSGEQDGMYILSGCEYNNKGHESISGVMHILGIGMKYDPELTREASNQEIVDGINAAGGIAVLAHPAWSLNRVEDAQALQGIMGAEIYNAVSEAHQSVRAYSDNFVDLCANSGIYYQLLATDDAHYYDGTDSCKGWVMVRTDALNDDALLQALRAGDFYATQGPELYVKREGNTLIIDCTPCQYIAVVSNLAWAKSRVLRGEDLTHFEYEIKETEKWLRVQVRDSEGNFAWSNIFIA